MISDENINPDTSLGDITDMDNKLDERWEKMYETSARLSGACCSLTIVKRGEILFSIMLNYITQEIIIACEKFIGYHQACKIPLSEGEFDYSNFKKIDLSFLSKDKATYITYLGKPIYKKCLEKAKLIPNNYNSVEEEPGGPLRILYLSDINETPVECIFSNGEKIGEWLGWLAFCKYSKKLTAFSVYPESDFSQKDNILMYPSPPYSILENRDDKMFLNFNKLMYFKNPSRYRELILITYKDNHHLTAIIEANKSRQLIF